MKKFIYKVTPHHASAFKQVAFFCSEEGKCSLEEIPSNQTKALENLLNNYGEEGWDLVNVNFGIDGLLAFWKKEIK